MRLAGALLVLGIAACSGRGVDLVEASDSSETSAATSASRSASTKLADAAVREDATVDGGCVGQTNCIQCEGGIYCVSGCAPRSCPVDTVLPDGASDVLPDGGVCGPGQIVCASVGCVNFGPVCSTGTRCPVLGIPCPR
jgi:hypothetical protein